MNPEFFEKLNKAKASLEAVLAEEKVLKDKMIEVDKRVTSARSEYNSLVQQAKASLKEL